MININLTNEQARKLAIYLGVQDLDDTIHIIDNHNLNIDYDEMDEVLQHLFGLLSCELKIEM